jgi:transposase-like protein
METSTPQEGVRALVRTLLQGSTTSATFDAESEELVNFLDVSAYITFEDLQELGINGAHDRALRAKFRYLAALLPDRSLHQLASSIHYVVNSDRVSISQVRDILRGRGQDVPLEKIQQIGKELANGTSLRQTAKNVEVSFDTVQRIEQFLGIAEARRLRLIDTACDAVRDGWSVRKFAEVTGLPKSTAHTTLNKAREVLKEIGEL